MPLLQLCRIDDMVLGLQQMRCMLVLHLELH